MIVTIYFESTAGGIASSDGTKLFYDCNEANEFFGKQFDIRRLSLGIGRTRETTGL